MLATAATARQTEFGEPAAADPPAWALAVPALGPASLDPRQRVEWVRRAGIVAAYRDLHAIPETQVSIGEAPSREPAFHDALWRQALSALGQPADALDYATPSDAELPETRAAWRRAEAWPPEFVACGCQKRRTCHAACWYSWSSPPSRSRRRTVFVSLADPRPTPRGRGRGRLEVEDEVEVVQSERSGAPSTASISAS